MKKKLLFLLLAGIPCMFLSAQKNTEIEPAVLECHYKFRAIKDTLTGEQRREDHVILRIGKNSSQFFSIYQHYIDSLTSTPGGVKLAGNMTAMLVRKRDYANIPGYRILTEYIYKNYPGNKITAVSNNGSVGHYIYEEEYLPQNWSIQDSIKSIGSYECQLATCDFRGRSYCAWFAPAIPISDGPWKFSGLPGLIMEIYDSGKQYHFELTETRSEELEPVTYYNFWKTKPERTTRTELLKIRRKNLEQSQSRPTNALENKPVQKIHRDFMEKDYR